MLTASSSSSRTTLTLSGETLPVGMLQQYCPHAGPVPAKPCFWPEPLPYLCQRRRWPSCCDRPCLPRASVTLQGAQLPDG